MGNRNYIKGRNKEYAICKEFKELGFEIAQRTAGSHSPIDVFAIDKKSKKIYFIQSKPENFEESKKKKINEELNYLNGTWEVIFELK